MWNEQETRQDKTRQQQRVLVGLNMQERLEDNEMAFGIFFTPMVCNTTYCMPLCVVYLWREVFFLHRLQPFYPPHLLRAKQSHTKNQPRKFDWADRVTKEHEHIARVNHCHLHQMLARHIRRAKRQFFSILFYFIYRVYLFVRVFVMPCVFIPCRLLFWLFVRFDEALGDTNIHTVSPRHTDIIMCDAQPAMGRKKREGNALAQQQQRQNQQMSKKIRR